MIDRYPFDDQPLEFGPERPSAQGKLLELAFGPADEQWLETCHPVRHVRKIKRICEMGGGMLDQGDTPVGPQSYEIALLALGAVLRCCDAAMSGEALRSFASIRPPGHHAEPERAMGFCLFSNVAIAARYLQKKHGVQRVGIVDFDVHHGNGTQACFKDDPSVYFVSLHQHPATCYPGSGYDWERGTGKGEGFTLNVPFEPGATDGDYVKAMRERVAPELDTFRPEVLLVSAGFDAHTEDPLASIDLTDEGFERITREIVGIADRHSGGRVISVLEGGYNLEALGRSVVRHLAAMA